jgi:hypothetical protein
MKFDKTTFMWLNSLQPAEPYDNFGVTQLKEYKTSLEEQGFSAADAPEIFDAIAEVESFFKASGSTDDSVISVKVENGLIEQVYGPAFVKDDKGNILLKVGMEGITVTVNKKNLTVNGLSGDIEITEETRDGRTYTSASVSLLDDEGNLFEIPLLLNFKDESLKINKKNLLVAAQKGDIAQYLSTINVGSGGNYIDLRWMPCGHYLSTDIVENKPHPEYGRSWSFNLLAKDDLGQFQEIGRFNSRGKTLEAQLASEGKLLSIKAKRNGVVFKISKHEVEINKGGDDKEIIDFPKYLADQSLWVYKARHFLNCGFSMTAEQNTLAPNRFVRAFLDKAKETNGQVPELSPSPEEDVDNGVKPVTVAATVIDEGEDLPF